MKIDGDPRLLRAAARIATLIRATPKDPRYPHTTPVALIVGGFVRDALLGQEAKDLDLEVYGVSPGHLDSLLDQTFPGLVNRVGASFGVAKVHLGDDLDFDVSIPRTESKSGSGHTGFTIASDPGMDVASAARRRDFTMNAISLDPLTGDLLDPFHGKEDIEKRLLRVVDSQTFQEDPLRVYRAVQFVARFGLTIEPKTLALMKEMVSRGDLEELPAERVTDELKKLLLKAEKPSRGLELMRDLGILERSFPELHSLIGTLQEHEWHPEGDVWTHTLMVVDAAAKVVREPTHGLLKGEDLEVMVGALCHDLGKPATTQHEDGRIRSRGHEEAGKAPTQQMLGRLRFNERIMAAAVTVAADHLKPFMLFRALEKGELTDASYANAVRKLLRRIHPVSWRVLLAVSEADHRGRGVAGAETDGYPAGKRFRKAVIENDLENGPDKPLLQGKDLLALGLDPGPQIGEAIKRIESLRDDGHIKTRGEALAAARQDLKDGAA